MKTRKQFYVNSFMAWMLVIAVTVVGAGFYALKILEKPEFINQIPPINQTK